MTDKPILPHCPDAPPRLGKERLGTLSDLLDAMLLTQQKLDEQQVWHAQLLASSLIVEFLPRVQRMVEDEIQAEVDRKSDAEEAPDDDNT